MSSLIVGMDGKKSALEYIEQKPLRIVRRWNKRAMLIVFSMIMKNCIKVILKP